MIDEETAFETARKISSERDCDIFLYNGEISRHYVLDFIELIHANKRCAEAVLILVTKGRDPDAGYKISRYIQSRYTTHTVLISGECKSAGTLIAVGAHTLVFARFGELGPLDIQSVRQDNLAERMSGLTVKEALGSLTRDAIRAHGAVFAAIIRDTNAVISIPTAAKAATDLITGIYAPMFSRIDPYDVGDKARAMRIASDYGKRLATHTKNLKPETLGLLTSTYPSHSFVIDFAEASELFEHVRLVNDDEQLLITSLGTLARVEGDDQEPTTACLSAPAAGSKGTSQSPDGSREPGTDASNSPGPGKKRIPSSEPGRPTGKLSGPDNSK